MTIKRVESPVVLIDLRDGEPDLEEVEGSVLVLDDAETAAAHDHLYQVMLGNPQVSGIICLAVGGRNSGGAVRVRPAPSLAPVEHAATLWIGDHHGITWGPGPIEPVVRAVRRTEPSGLDQLIDAITEPLVFETVVRTVSALPYSTASVGMVLERTSLHENELRQVRDEAITQFTDPDAGLALAREVPRGEFRAAVRVRMEPDLDEEVLVPGGELATAYTRATTTLRAAEDAIARMDHALAPLRRQRPSRTVGALVEEARSAGREFHERANLLLLRIDDNLRGQRGTREDVVRLGVRGPIAAYPREARDDVRGLVEEWLGKYRSIAHLQPDLDAARIEHEPQGCLSAIEELGTQAPPTDPAPAFTLSPVPRFAVPLTALTGVLAAIGVLPGILTGVLALAWFAAGLLLHARQPTANGELGFLRALSPAAMHWSLPSILGSLVVLTAGVPPVAAPWQVVPTLLAVLTFVAVVGTGWRRGVRRWRRELDPAGLHDRLEAINGLLNDVVRTEWRPSARRALFAEGLRQVTEGLTSVQKTLVERAGDVFTVPAGLHTGAPTGDDVGRAEYTEPGQPPDRDIYEEVREVIVTDLVDLTIAALRPAWTGIELGRPAAPAEYAESTIRLLGTCHEHVQRQGLLLAPPFARQFTSRGGSRETLAAKLWAASHVTDALTRRAEDPMTQLCHGGHLTAVNAMADGARLARFAPTAVRRLTQDTTGPSPAVTWTGETEIAGTLRFVPLKLGVFE